MGSSRLFFILAGLLTSSVLVSCSGSNSDEVVLINRQNSSGTYKYFQGRVLNDNDFKSNTKDQSGSQAVVDLVGNTPSAIGYSGMGYKTDKVKMLPISEKKGETGVPPNAENAANGTYPITRNLYIYTKGDPQGPVRHYVDWILSDEGQAIVSKKGYVPVATQELGGTPPEGEVAFQVTGSDTMIQISQAWAEAYSAKYPSVKVQVTGGGSGVGIAGMIAGAVDIANASRAMKSTELAKAKGNGVEPKEFIVGQDALAIYVHKDNPLASISIEDLAQLYGEGGSISNWSQIHGYPVTAPTN